LVALEFFAGLDESSMRACISRAEYWLQHVDRHGFVVARLAQIARGGAWHRSAPGLYQRILERLWYQITSDKDWALARYFITVFASVDEVTLASIALREPTLDTRIQEALCDLISFEKILANGLFDRLHTNLQNYLPTQNPKTAPSDSIDSIVADLGNHLLSSDALEAALEKARKTGSTIVAQAILSRLRRTDDPADQESLVMALSSMFMLLPDDDMVAVLVDSPPFPKELRKVASAAIANSAQRGQRINPAIRDKLLRRLAVHEKNDVRNEAILEALLSYPIRYDMEANKLQSWHVIAPWFVQSNWPLDHSNLLWMHYCQRLPVLRILTRQRGSKH